MGKAPDGNGNIEYTLIAGGQYQFNASGPRNHFLGGTNEIFARTFESDVQFNSDVYFVTDVDFESNVNVTGSLNVNSILNVTGEGRFSADVVAYYSSDRRFKDNIFTIESPIDKIKKISGVEFDWNEKGPAWTRSKEFGNTSGALHDIGVVAQEIQEILPEAVRTRKDGYLSVNYEKIIPLLIEGIKEQQTTIEDLQSRIKKLENN